jgi:CNT family concentrative nucleoside transporter
MSTISAALLATYASLGVPPLYLLAANMMGIPGGLALAKLVWPSPPEESTQALPEPEATEASNAIDAAVQGAQEGLHISLAVVAMVIAFVSFVALIDAGLGWFGLSLAEVLGYVFYPLSFLIGTPLEEAGNVASLIGLKLSTNEFVAYLELLRRQELCPMSPRSLMLATIALCGFANFGSVAIQLGAFSKMLPERRGEFAKLGLPAMAVGALASCLSACWASLFFGS